MVTPLVTLTYLVPLAGLFGLLSLVVVFLRVKNDIPYGNGGNASLNVAVRAHGNFAEWVPIVVIVVGGLELLGEPVTHIHWLMGMLFLARVLHPIGLSQRVGSPVYLFGRIFGAFVTWAVLIVAVVLLFIRL